MSKRIFNVKRIVFSILLLVIFLFVGFAVVTPTGICRDVYIPDESPVLTIDGLDFSKLERCNIRDKIYVPNSISASVAFNLDDVDFKTVTFSVKNKKPLLLRFFYDTGDGYSNYKSFYCECKKGKPAIVAFDKIGKVISVKCEFYEKLQLDSVQAYSSYNVNYYNPKVNKFYYAIVGVVALLLTLTFVFLDIKFELLKKLFDIIKVRKKTLFFFIVFCIADLIFSLCLEIILNRFILKYYWFNIYRFVFIFLLILLIYAFYVFKETVHTHPERLFLSISLILGIMMVILTPVGHASWDVESHYKFALISTGVNRYYTIADESILLDHVESIPSVNPKQNVERITAFNESDDIIVDELAFHFYPFHLPSGIFIRVAKFLNLSFLWSFTIGKIPNILIYSFVCYLAIKKLKSGKTIMSIIALFPTSIYLASNYSYDFWVLSFTLLGFSYYFSEIQQPEKTISSKTVIKMCSSFLIGCISKAVYIPLLLIPYFMPKTKIKNKKKYYTVCTIAIVILFAIMIYQLFFNVSTNGDARGGSNINPVKQIAYIFTYPLKYTKLLLTFIVEYMSIPQMQGYISFFSVLGFGYGYSIFVVMLIISAMLDKNELDKYSSTTLNRWIIGFACFATVSLVATSMYIAFTNVGTNSIMGCQPRYLLPLIFPIAYVMGPIKLKKTISDKKYNMIIFIVSSVVIIYNIYKLLLIRMI